MSDFTRQQNEVTAQAPRAGWSDAAHRSGPGVDYRPRVWPGALLVGVTVAVSVLPIVAPTVIEPATMMHFYTSFFLPLFAAALLVVWWLFLSRVPWLDRLLGLAVLAVPAVPVMLLAPENSRFAVVFYGSMLAATAWVGWLVVSAPLSWPARRIGMVAVVVLAWGFCSQLRYDGASGAMLPELSWRWSPRPEDSYLAEIAQEKETASPTAAPLKRQAGDWVGFRGEARDGRLTGVRIATDWGQKRPRELWRRRVGPGWSSFAVVGDRAFTQEQRGGKEVVLCLDAATGRTVWVHEDAARFNEAVGGPGPRATPTFHDGKLFTLGARGTLNCLDAATGRRLWSADVQADAEANLPEWGFASSPLVADGVVTVFAGGADGKSVLGYHADSGRLEWAAGEGQYGYSSPQLFRLGGADQVVISTDAGLTAFAPKTGKVLWQYEWQLPDTLSRVTQPALVNGSDFLIGTGFSFGTRRVRVAPSGDGWTTSDVWESKAIKPYYNDLVVHQGHLYGFDGIFFTCVSLADGERTWRVRGYGNGQVLLLVEQGLLLVLSDRGEVVLLEANPERHVVRGRFQAIKGKTWNHPVIAHGKLFVRNGEEAACFQLDERKE